MTQINSITTVIFGCVFYRAKPLEIFQLSEFQKRFQDKTQNLNQFILDFILNKK